MYNEYLKALNKPFRKLAKIEFLNPDGTVAFALDNQRRKFGKQSSAFIQSGSLNVAMNNGQRRKATITLANLDGEFDYNVNNLWFGQQIRLSMGMVLPSGKEFYLPQMVGEIATPSFAFTPSMKTATFPLVDKWARLDGTLGGILPAHHRVENGADIFDAISQLLKLSIFDYTSETDDIALQVDNILPIFTQYYNDKYYQNSQGDSGTTGTLSYLKTPYTIESPTGTTLAQLILDLNACLVGLIGYDATGALRLDASQDDVDDSQKPVMWHFTPKNSILCAVSESVQNTKVYNDVLICGQGLTGYEVWGRAQNVDAKSDTNIFRIGQRTYYESRAEYWNSQQCADLATYLLKRKTVLQKSVNITCGQMFHLIENNLITVERVDKVGAPVERHLINSFTIPIGETGNMTINAISVNDIPNFKTIVSQN